MSNLNCPACDIKMEPLIEGIFQCPQCKKIVKQSDNKIEEKEKIKIEEGMFQEGMYFHTNASLNKQYEICEKGITINKTENRLFAALICHSAYLKDEKYVRLSWWKNYQHAGMFKIYDKHVLNNTINALEKVDDSFNDIWSWSGKYGKQKYKTKEDLEREKNLEKIELIAHNYNIERELMVDFNEMTPATKSDAYEKTPFKASLPKRKLLVGDYLSYRGYYYGH